MESAWELWESFWVAGVRRGAVLRRFDGELLTTRIAFDDGVGAPLASESRIWLSGSRDTWSRLRYRQEPGGLRAAADRVEAGLGVDTLPASGDYLLLSRLAGSAERSAGFLRVDEAQPERPAAPAEIRRRPAEDIDLLEGRTVLAERLDVVAGGMRVAMHWAHRGAIVRSSWGGALLFGCRDEPEALAGLNPRMGEFLREGFGES